MEILSRLQQLQQFGSHALDKAWPAIEWVHTHAQQVGYDRIALALLVGYVGSKAFKFVRGGLSTLWWLFTIRSRADRAAFLRALDDLKETFLMHASNLSLLMGNDPRKFSFETANWLLARSKNPKVKPKRLARELDEMVRSYIDEVLLTGEGSIDSATVQLAVRFSAALAGKQATKIPAVQLTDAKTDYAVTRAIWGMLDNLIGTRTPRWRCVRTAGVLVQVLTDDLKGAHQALAVCLPVNRKDNNVQVTRSQRSQLTLTGTVQTAQTGKTSQTVVVLSSREQRRLEQLTKQQNQLLRNAAKRGATTPSSHDFGIG